MLCCWESAAVNAWVVWCGTLRSAIMEDLVSGWGDMLGIVG